MTRNPGVQTSTTFVVDDDALRRPVITVKVHLKVGKHVAKALSVRVVSVLTVGTLLQYRLNEPSGVEFYTGDKNTKTDASPCHTPGKRAVKRSSF